MAINFPNSPSVNDTFTSGGTTFTWNGSSWVSAISTNIVDDTTPQLGGDLDGTTKNINNVGVITAGIVTATSFYGDGTNLTGIDASSITSGGAVKVQAVSTGATVTGNLDVSGDLNVTGVSTFQSNVNLGDNDRLRIGDDGDLQLWTDQYGKSHILSDSAGHDFKIDAKGGLDVRTGALSQNAILATNNTVQLYYDNSKKFETTSTGISVTGDGVFSGNVSIAGTLTYEDVTNIDSIGLVTARSGVRVTGGGLDVVGVSTFNGRVVGAGVSNVIPFLYANLSDLPSATTYHGAFAHVHATGKAYYAHAGAWVELVSNNVETSGNVLVGSGITMYAATGIVSATAFYGDGTNLTGIDASALTSGGTVKVQAVSTGATVTGNLDVSGVIRQELHTPGMPMGLNDDIGEHWYATHPNIGQEILDKINDLVYCGDGIVLAAAGGYYGDVFRSTDYGKTWTNAEIGLGDTEANVQALSYCGNGIVLAGHKYSNAGSGDIYRSTDFGLTWTKIEMGSTLEGILSFAYCGNGIVLAGSGNNSDDGDVYRSTDYGQTWTKVEMGSTLARIDALCYIGNGIALAGSGGNPGDADVYRSTDFGQTWTKIEMGGTLETIGAFAYCGNGIVLAGSGSSTGDGDVYRSTDFGENWTQIEMGSSFEEVLSLAYCDNGIVLAGTGTGTGDAFVYKSIDYGQTWTQVVVDQYGSSQTIESLCYLGNGTVLAGGGNTMLRGDVWRSDVGFSQGSTAQSIHHQNVSGNIGIGSIEPAVKLDVEGFIKQELHTPGMLVGLNDDIGKVWNKVEIGAGIEKIHALVYCGKGIVLAGSGTGGNDGDIYRSTDFGRTFTQIEMGPGNDQIHSFAYCGNGIVLAGGGNSTQYGDVYRSTDDGQTWTKVEMGADLESILSLVYCGDGIALAGSGSSTGDGDIYRSTDYGQTWTKTFDSTDLETIYSLCYLGNGIVLAGSGSGTNDGDVYRSTDFGQNWTKIEMGLSNQLEAIHTIVYCGSGVVLAGAGFDTDGIRGNGVVFRSKNYGKTWVREIPRVDGSSQTDLESIHSLVYCDNGIVLAGTGSDTGDGDILKSTDLGVNWTKIEMGSDLESILSLVYCGDGLVLAGGGSSTGDGDVYRSDVGFSQPFLSLSSAPKIIAFDPAGLSTGVAVDSNITITFDQNIQFGGTGTIELRSTTTSGTVIESFAITSGSPASGLSISGTQLIINPTSNLSADTVVYVILPSEGIQAASGGLYYEGSNNYNFRTVLEAFTAQGGDYVFNVYDTNSPTNYYKFHIFTNPGIATFTSPISEAADFQFLAVGGGGGGGGASGPQRTAGGGGGAGGVITGNQSNLGFTSGTYTVTIGAGGQSGQSEPTPDVNIAQPGGATTFSGPLSLTAFGGGAGGQLHSTSDPHSIGNPGGSGGGGGGGQVDAQTFVPGGTAQDPAQGNAGGRSKSHAYFQSPSPTPYNVGVAGGGGGAGGAGGDAQSFPSSPPTGAFAGGNGGTGRAVPAFASSYLAANVPVIPNSSLTAIGPTGLYGGGGGGGFYPGPGWGQSGLPGPGGGGGGYPHNNGLGNPVYSLYPPSFRNGAAWRYEGADYTGGGAGGGAINSPSPSTYTGGKGVLMIRYETPAP